MHLAQFHTKMAFAIDMHVMRLHVPVCCAVFNSFAAKIPGQNLFAVDRL